MRDRSSASGARSPFEVIDHVPPWLTPARTVLFHHGLGTRSACWDGWTPALGGRHRLVRFDMRGHGASPLPAGFRWSLAALVDDLLEVADATGAERFHLVGESTGGTVALAVAARHPGRVLSVTVSNGAHRGGSIRNLEPWRRIIREEGMAAWSAHMMGQRFFEGALTDGMRRWYETRQANSDPDAILGATAMLVAVDLLPELERVTCPVLLLHPDSSPFIPWRRWPSSSGRFPTRACRCSPTRATACRSRTRRNARPRSPDSSTGPPPRGIHERQSAAPAALRGTDGIGAVRNSG